MKALGDEGLLERVFAGSAQELCQLREGLAHGCTEAETALALQGLGGYPILRAAKPELRDRWIPKLSAGEAVAAFALSEPEAGSDAAALELRAEEDGDGFRLTGTKLWISNAPEADVYSVFARTSDDGAKGITAFAIPRESEGLTGEHLELVAPHPIGRLDFDGVPAGPEQVLGEIGGGFAVAMDTLDLFRPSVGAFGVGMAQAALDAAVRYTSEREAFGKPLARLPGGRPPARRGRDADPGRAAARQRRGEPVRRGRAAGAQGVGDGEALRDRDGAARRGRRDPGARRQSPPEGTSARAPLPRGAGAADLRGRIRGAARDHRQRALQGTRLSKDKSVNYTSYLALEEILGAQRPRSDEHDEILFIVVHQVYELWFKQLIHELRYLQRMLEEGNDPRAFATFKRVLTILKLVVAQLDVIETMTPVQFLEFRDRLEAASGFQSGQFRELEAILGRRDPGVLDAYHEGGVDYDRVKAAMARPSVYDSFLHYLDARGYDVPEEILERDVTQPVEESAGVQAALLRAYRDDSGPAQVAERMVDFDEGLMEWRYHHVKMVERTIGSRPGTGGSAGAAYLRTTLHKPFFPDLWAVRSEL